VDTDRETKPVVTSSFKTIDELIIAGDLRRFLKTRRLAQTRFYIGLFLLFLSDARQLESQNEGWVLSKDLRNELVAEDKIPNTSTFYKLIGDLHAAKLIEKRIGKKRQSILGGPPIYCRVPVVYQLRWFIIPEEILADYYIANSEAIDRANDIENPSRCERVELPSCGTVVDFDIIKTVRHNKELAGIRRDIEFLKCIARVRPPPEDNPRT
jgi:hypothetical protein